VDDLPCPASGWTMVRGRAFTKLIEALGVNGTVKRLKRNMKAGHIHYHERRPVGDHCPLAAA